MQYLGSMGMNRVISESCYKVTILQKSYRKMTMNGHFPIIPFENSIEKNLEVTTGLLYPNPCHIKVYYKGTAMY